MKWLGRRGLLRRDDDDSAHERPSTTEALTLFGMERGKLVAMRENEDATVEDADASAPPPPPRKSDAVEHERFNLHASIRIGAADDFGRERLCRHLTRPAFALRRLRLLRDGSVAYRVKKITNSRATERIMSPVECLARLSAILAPPRYPLLTFAGVLAPRHVLRRRIVPRPPSPQPRARAKRCNGEDHPKHDASRVTDDATPGRIASPKPATYDGLGQAHGAANGCVAPTGDGRAALVASEGSSILHELPESFAAQRIAPNILSADHWDRLLDGELFATSSRPPWALLLRRTFDVDLRTCARCGGPLSIRAVVSDPTTIALLFDALGRARDPPAAA